MTAIFHPEQEPGISRLQKAIVAGSFAGWVLADVLLATEIDGIDSRHPSSAADWAAIGVEVAAHVALPALGWLGLRRSPSTETPTIIE